MTHILHVHASPKGEYSASGKMANKFLEFYQARHPDHTVSTLSLFDCELPEFGQDQVTAKFAPLFDEELSKRQKEKWQEILDMIGQFDKADKLIISTPMWNGSIPYKLKHYIDILVQPLVSFGFNAETGEHFGLLRDRPTQFILTRSSVAVGDPFDSQLPYLKSIFDFIGITDHRFVIADATTQPTAEQRASYLEGFTEELQAAAHQF